MVHFKIYDKRQKKFVGQDHAGKAWTIRYDLDIWNNNVNDNKLGEMYKVMKNNDKHLELYVKIDGRFRTVTKEVIDTITTQYKKGEPERKASRKKRREKSKKIHIKRCHQIIKASKRPNPPSWATGKTRIKRCQELIKNNKTKKKA